MTEDIKNKMKLKNKFYGQYMTHQTQTNSLLKVEGLPNDISNLITKSKDKYYQRINAKLNDPSLSNKTCWSILTIFAMVKKFLLYLRCLSMINLLQIFKKSCF